MRVEHGAGEQIPVGVGLLVVLPLQPALEQRRQRRVLVQRRLPEHLVLFLRGKRHQRPVEARVDPARPQRQRHVGSSGAVGAVGATSTHRTDQSHWIHWIHWIHGTHRVEGAHGGRGLEGATTPIAWDRLEGCALRGIPVISVIEPFQHAIHGVVDQIRRHRVAPLLPAPHRLHQARDPPQQPQPLPLLRLSAPPLPYRVRNALILPLTLVLALALPLALALAWILFIA